MTATVEQHVALGEEVRTSVELIKAGLGYLQLMGAANEEGGSDITIIEEGARMQLRILEDEAKSEEYVFYSVSSYDDVEPCKLMVFRTGRTWFGRVKFAYKRQSQEDDWKVIDRNQAVQLIENEISKVARKKGGTTA